MDSRNKYPEKLNSNLSYESEFASPFLGEIFTEMQSPELELMQSEFDIFIQESPFINVVENIAYSSNEAEIHEFEDIQDDVDEELEDELFYGGEELADTPDGEMDYPEGNESEEPGNFLADEADEADEADDEWDEMNELEDDESSEEKYETADSSIEEEFFGYESDNESYFDENEMDIEENEYESRDDGLENEHRNYDFTLDEIGDFGLNNEIDEEAPYDDEFEIDNSTSVSNDGLSTIAIQAEKQWNASKDRPAKWINNVYGLVVHTTGGSLPGKAITNGIYPTLAAINWYTRGNMHKEFHGGCHYVNGWQGIQGGDLFQIANEREKAHGVGTVEQRQSISKGNFEKDLPSQLVNHWRKRWPGYKDSLDLLPDGERYANSCYIHVECTPVVYFLRDKKRHKKTVISSEYPPMRAGLRFTKAQHDAIAYLACDIAIRNGWPLGIKWWRTTRLLGHEDLTPISRRNKNGGYDPGYLRDRPYFDWDYVYSKIEIIKGEGYKIPGRKTISYNRNISDNIIQGVKNTAGNLYQIGKLINIANLAVSKGERDENIITNIVFYSKHPNKKGIKLKRNDPLVKDWLDIQKNIVRPILKGLSNTKDSKVNDSRNGHLLPESKLGYVKYSNGDSKRITPGSVLWLAKMIDAETWGKPTENDARSMLWALVQRTAIRKFRKWSWVKMIQAYSQPINPRWTSSGDKCSQFYKSSFGGTIPERCSVRRVNRRSENIGKKWEDVHPVARRVVLEFIAGQIPNHIPGAVGWFAPGTWKSRERNGKNKEENMVYHSTIDGNVYFAMNKNPDTTKWTTHELIIINA